MKRKIEVLIVEDDPKDLNDLVREIDNNSELFHLCGTTDSADDALRQVKEFCPDAIILDLELHQGMGDGLTFLKDLKAEHLPRTPFILVNTNNISKITHQIARELGADFIYTKTKPGYTCAEPVNFLKSVRHTIISQRTVHDEGATAPTGNTPDLFDKRVRRLINNELNAIGVNPKSIGFTYLTEAIEMVIRHRTQHICNEIGKKYKKAESSVERAMQNAINRAWNHSDPNDLFTHYTAAIHSDKGVPTITEFIFYYGRKIEAEL